MPRKRLHEIHLTEKQKNILSRISVMTTTEYRYRQRASIIMKAANGEANKTIVQKVKVTRDLVRRWLNKWAQAQATLAKMEEKEKNHVYEDLILQVLKDEPRSGAPAKFTAEQFCSILAVACEKPEDSNNILSHWSTTALAKEVVKRGIVTNISRAHTGRFLKSSGFEAA